MEISCSLKAFFSAGRVYWAQESRERACLTWRSHWSWWSVCGRRRTYLTRRPGPRWRRRGAADSTRPGAQGEPEGAPPQDEPPAGGERGRFYGLALTVGGKKEQAGPSGRTEGEKAEGGPWAFLQDLLRASLENRLEVWQGERLMTGVPLLILALLLVLAFWITLPLLLVGLMLGCRYRLAGPDFDKSRNEPRKK